MPPGYTITVAVAHLITISHSSLYSYQLAKRHLVCYHGVDPYQAQALSTTGLSSD